MRRNHIQRIIQSHPRLRQQIRRRLQHRQRPQPLIEPLERLHLPPAIFTSRQMLLQHSGQLIRKLTVVQQHNTISCILTLHCPTSTSLKFLLTPGVSSSPLFSDSHKPGGPSTSEFGQIRSQLSCGPKQRIFRRLLCRAQHLADRPQLQPLIVLQLKDCSFARRQLAQRLVNPFAHHLPVQLASRVRHRPLVGDVRHQVHLIATGIQYRRRIFPAALSPPQLVQTKIRHNPVEPRIEAALEAEVSKVPVRLDKGFLVNILRILLVAEHMQRQPQHRLVIPPHQCIKRSALALLSLANQLVVFGPLLRPRIELRLRQFAAVPVPD